MNNINVLPFYLTLQEQHFRAEYAYGEKFSLIAPKQKLLPFQIVRDASENSVSDVTLVNFNTGTETDLTADIAAAGLSYQNYGSYDVIYFTGINALSTQLQQGLHYLRISDGAEVWYSDLLNLVSDVSDYLKIEYWDGANLVFEGGEIHYQNRFKLSAYLPTVLGYPEYIFEEQVTRRDGLTFPEKRLAYKTYKFNFIAPEYLCDALRVAAISDKVYITDKNKTYISDRFLMTPKWQSGGFYAVIEAEFEAGTIFKKTGILAGDGSGDFNTAFTNGFTNGFL